MKITFNGNEIGIVIENHSMTLEEAIYVGLGIDINSQEDCRKAYESGEPYAYMDDCGNYCIDLDNMEIEGER